MKFLPHLLIYLLLIIAASAQEAGEKFVGGSSLDRMKISLQKLVDAKIKGGNEGLTTTKQQVRQYLQAAEQQQKPFHATHAARLLSTLERSNGNITVLLYYDSLRIAFARIYGRPDTLFLALHSYTHDLININRVRDATPVLDEARHIADSIGKPSYQAAVYMNVGAHLFKQFKVQQAIPYFKLSAAKAELNNDQYKVAENKLWVATCMMYSGKFDSTIAEIYEALDFYKKVDYKPGIANCYGTLGQAYQFNGNMQKAIEYFQDSRKLYLIERDAFRLTEQSQKLATLYTTKKDFDSAFYFIAETEAFYKKMNYRAGIAMVNTLKGIAYSSMGKTDTAKIFFSTAAEINKSEKNDMLDLAVNGYEAINAVRSGDSAAAARMMNQTAKKMKDMLPKSLLQDGANRLKSAGAISSKIDSAELSDDFGSVLLNPGEVTLNPLTNTRHDLDKMIGAMNNQMLTEMETKYRTRLIDDSLKIERENVAITKKSLQRRNVIVVLVFLLVIILTIGFLLESRNRKRAESDRSKIELLQREIHHRVKNNLAVIIRLIEVAGKKMEDNDAMVSLQNRVRAIELLHQKLYQNEEALGKVSMQPYLLELIELIRPTVSYSKDIKTSVKANVEMGIDTSAKIGLIVNELVTNSFKYAFENKATGNIDVRVRYLDHGGYLLSVSDDGPGFDTTVKYKSYGMVLIKGLSHTLNGKFKFTSAKGTAFELELPAEG